MTKRGFRKKFRYSRPEKSATFMQFRRRLNSDLNKWLAMAKVEQLYEAVCDFLTRDQVLDSCKRKQSSFTIASFTALAYPRIISLIQNEACGYHR